jgi:hypothetical protein
MRMCACLFGVACAMCGKSVECARVVVACVHDDVVACARDVLTCARVVVARASVVVVACVRVPHACTLFFFLRMSSPLTSLPVVIGVYGCGGVVAHGCGGVVAHGGMLAGAQKRFIQTAKGRTRKVDDFITFPLSLDVSDDLIKFPLSLDVETPPPCFVCARVREYVHIWISIYMQYYTCNGHAVQSACCAVGVR